MVDTILVSKTHGTVNRQSSYTTTNQVPSESSSQSVATSTSQEDSNDCMSCLRRNFRKQGFSYRTTDILIQSWKPGTRKQYKGYIQKWVQYCNKKQIDYIQNSVKPILHFLTELFELGLSYSSLNTARGALSALGISVDKYSIGQHPLIIRLMKGVFNIRPSRPRYQSTWDVNQVLLYLRKLSPVKYLSLKDLTLKLTFLIALINAARSQSIHLMSVNSVHKLKGERIFVIDQLVKQKRPGYMEPNINIKAYPSDSRICVYTVYKEYVVRTKTLRKNHSKLLLSYVKPYLPVTRDTISRWIKTVLGRAKIDTSIYKTHIVRSASVSKAKENLMPVSEILNKAGWSNSKTFARFYDKKIEKDEDSFTYHVLKNTK